MIILKDFRLVDNYYVLESDMPLSEMIAEKKMKNYDSDLSSVLHAHPTVHSSNKAQRRSEGTVNQDNEILINPGETILFKAEIVDNSIVKITKIDCDNWDPTYNIVVSFKMETDEEGGPLAMMKITNLFDKGLKYTSKIQYQDGPDFYDTTNVGVYPKLAAWEIWAEPLAKIKLIDFKLVEYTDELYSK